MRLKGKLLSLLVPLLLVPLLLLAWASYTQLRDQSVERHQRELTTLLGQLQLTSRALMDTAAANLELFANSSQIQAYLLNDSEADRYLLMQPSLLRLLASYQAAYPEYYEVRVLLPDGYEDTRSVRSAIRNHTEDEAGSALFQALEQRRAGVLLRFDENPDDGKFVLYAGKAIGLRDASDDPLSAAPKLRGYLVLTIDLAALARQITASQAGASGHLFAVDGDGVIRIHAEPRRIGTRLGPEWIEWLNSTEAGRSAHSGQLAGTAVSFHAARIDENLSLIAAYPAAVIDAGTTQLAQIVAGIALLALIVMVAVSYWFMNSVFIRPVQHLRDATRQVREGNLRVELDVASDDEIGDLARAFREMGEGLHASQEQIRFHAYHDNLTGLPNRFMFRQQLEQAVSHARHYQETLGVLFADVDGFKRVNDTLGHHAGDELLRQISERIRSMVRQQDYLARPEELDPTLNVVSRIGGDEFVVLISQMSHAVEASKIAQRIIDVIARPFQIADQEIYVGISIGVALFPVDAESAEELLQRADMAMFHAKAAGKNNFQFYSSQMNAIAVNSLSLEARLRRAMERDELFMVYQPKVDLRSGRTVGVEALIRWEHPEEGMIPPATFIPIAEEVGLINTLGEWILRSVCRQIRAWEDSAAADLVVAVNISSRQIANPHFGLIVQQMLRECGVPGTRLEFEITETSIMTMESYIDAAFRTIRDLDITISLDDFGTGYSSLSHLRRFPIDYLKIDRSFVDEALTNPDDRAIVSAIIGMAQNLGLQVVAEGVETPEQARFMREKGCDLAQGYYFGRPMQAADLFDYITREHAKIPDADGDRLGISRA
jgi:diguanylate cyclase (GGDEF)-like protein